MFFKISITLLVCTTGRLCGRGDNFLFYYFFYVTIFSESWHFEKKHGLVKLVRGSERVCGHFVSSTYIQYNP